MAKLHHINQVFTITEIRITTKILKNIFKRILKNYTSDSTKSQNN